MNMVDSTMTGSAGEESRIRVLVLDDVEDERILIIRALEKQGLSCTIAEADSRETFIRELESFRPDIVLADYLMPDFTGLQAIKLLEEQYSRVPVIIVTGRLDDETAVGCIKKGAADYLLKESLSRLAAAVTGALEKKSLQDDIENQHIALREAALDWQNTFHAIDGSVMILDSEQKILRCNKATEDILQKPSADLIGKKCYKLFHCLDHPIEGCPFLLTKEQRARENLYLSIGGKTLDVVTYPLFREDGTMRGAVHVMNDITPIFEAQQKLQMSEERFRDLYDNGPSAYFTIAPTDGTILQCNRQAALLTGYSHEALIGMDRIDLYADTEHGKVKAKKIFHLFRQGETIQDQELQMVRKNGESLWVSLTVSPVFDDSGKVIESRSVLIDISERKKMELQLRQAQKMEAVGNLAGGIAHDFNNILSAVIGFTELVLEKVTPGSTMDGDLREVYSAGLRAKELVSQILTFARQHDEVTRPMQMSIIIKEALKFLRSTIPTSITIEQNIESDSLIMGDPTQVHQIIMNLCTNAAHAMEESGGVLMVSLQDVTVDTSSLLFKEGIKIGDYVELKVSDTGTGIAPKVISSIFEPYYSTKAIGKGTGLGLAVVQGIVEKSCGKITVESRKGEGTVFNVYLPITERPEVDQVIDQEVVVKGTERILFVDDEDSIVKMGCRVLGSLGYVVTPSTSSIEALALFTSHPGDFDLVITDMTMPNMTGDLFAAKLKTIRPDISVILCTGYSNRISEATISELGINALVNKPFVKNDLAKEVRKVLDDAQSSSHT